MATVDLRYQPAGLSLPAEEGESAAVTPLDHLGSLALLAIVFSTFIATVGDFSRAVVVGAGMAVLAVLAIVRGQGKSAQWALIAFGICMVWYALSSFYDQTFRLDINYYVAPIVALGAFNIRPKILITYILGAMCVQVLLQLYEWVTGNFIYYTVGKYDDGQVFDEEAFEGAAGVFRSKGLFEGPTVMGGTLIYFSVITRLNPIVILMSIFCCILGYARLGLTLNVLLLLIFLVSSFNPQRVILIALAMLVSLALGYYLFTRVTDGEFNFDFISSTFDTGSSQNESRIDFWMRAVDFIGSMSASEFIFGAASRFFLEIGNSAENAWTNILALAGLPMLVVYLLACFWFTRGSRFALVTQSVIFASAMIAANFQSLATCILFWLAALVATRPVSGTRRKASRTAEPATALVPRAAATGRGLA